MKFTEGMWRVREGISFDWMSNVEQVHVGTDQVDLLLSKIQRNRGDTLNVPTLSATVSTPLEGIIGVKFTHWAGEEDRGPDFDVVKDKTKVSIDHQSRKSLVYTSGSLTLNVNTSPNELGMSFDNAPSSPTSKPKRLTGHSFRSIAHVSDSNTSGYKASDGLYSQRDHYILLELDLSVHEKLYGLGERFGPFIKNGQAVDVWNEDGGTSSELTYKNIPFYISSRGYGVFINHPGKVMLELQSERTTRVNIAVKGEDLEYMIIAGPTPKEILSRYTALTGRPSLPPAWSYGLWLTTSFTTSYDEQTVTSFLDGLQERKIPLGVFHFDCFWMKAFQWCDFQFDTDNFPDAAGYIQRIKSRGLKTCVWINPYIGQASPLFKEGKTNHYFVMRADTPAPTVWQWDHWQAGMALVDFTNPDACEWYASHLTRLMEMGIDSFKTDFGERIPFDPAQVRYHDGSDPVRMHNFYAFLYNKLVFEWMQAAGKDGCLFARSATAGSQRFPVHWGGDCESTFEAMAESLRGGLSLALSGFGFWAHDIGGFEGLPPPALYKRWVQFGLLSSHSRLHGSSSYRVPWIYGKENGEDEKCSAVLRECVRRKLSLMPYLLRTGLETHKEGTPVMRAMFLEFPHDANTYQLDTQFMLGENLLVAPVFTEDGEVTFYVPQTEVKTGAKWRSWFDYTKTYEEGRWYTETHPFETLPLLVRPGTVTAVNPQLEKADGEYLEGLEILVNGPLEAETAVQIVEAKATDTIAMTLKVGVTGELQHHQRHAARRGGRKSVGTSVKTVAMDRDVVVTRQSLD
jgi:alpha-D-xyloside xylohydrolase